MIVGRWLRVLRCGLNVEDEVRFTKLAFAERDPDKYDDQFTPAKESELRAVCEQRFSADEVWRKRFGPDAEFDHRYTARKSHPVSVHRPGLEHQNSPLIPPDDEISDDQMKHCTLCGEPRLRYGCELYGDDACYGAIITDGLNIGLEALTAEEQFSLIRLGFREAFPEEFYDYYTPEREQELLANCEKRFARDQSWRERFGPDEAYTRRHGSRGR